MEPAHQPDQPEPGATTGPAGPEETGPGVSRIATLIVVATGIALVAYQFAFNPSLSIDELAVVNNVLARDLPALVTTPLDYDQVAPIGFLALVKASSVAFGSSEMALRLVPLLGVLAAITIFVLLSRTLLTPAVVPLAVAVFCIARPTIRAPTLVKQYGLDLGISVALLWIGVQLVRRERIHPGWLVLGVAAPWFSQPSVLVLPAVALAWALSERRARGRLQSVVTWTAAWGLSSLAAVLVGRRLVTPSTMAYMHGYWDSAFWPLWPVSVRTVLWPAAAMRDVLAVVASLPLPELALIVIAIGALYWLRSNRSVALLAVAPLALALLASAFGLYPFSDRMMYFVLPLVALLVGAAFEALGVVLGSRRRQVFGLVVVALVATRVVHFLLSNAPPYHFQHIRPILAGVAVRSKPGDRFLVTYGAEQAWRYYAPRIRLDDRSAIFLACRRGPITGQLSDLAGLDSGRVWLVFSLAARSPTPRLLVHALSQRGALLTAFPADSAESTVSAHLFDLDAPPSVARGAPAPSIRNPDPPGPCRGPAVVRPPAG